MNFDEYTIRNIKSAFNWKSQSDWREAMKDVPSNNVDHYLVSTFTNFMIGPISYSYVIEDGEIKEKYVRAVSKNIVEDEIENFLNDPEHKNRYLYEIFDTHNKNEDGKYVKNIRIRYGLID